MILRQKINGVNFIQLVIVENLDIPILQQVQIDLMGIISNPHDKRTFCIKFLYFGM